MLATVEHVAERMTHLMLQLRTGDAPMLNPQPVDLGVLLRRLRSRHAAGERIQLNAPESGIAVLGHEDHLERVIGHLVQNAIDASPDGLPVEIGVNWQDSTVRLEVVDRGCGMTEEFLRNRLFRPFQTSKANGMGLGAFECQQYVKSLGGALAVRSAPGIGTTVTVELRSARRENKAAVEAAP
jgi:signal transduction histidine kinase